MILSSKYAIHKKWSLGKPMYIKYVQTYLQGEPTILVAPPKKNLADTIRQDTNYHNMRHARNFECKGLRFFLEYNSIEELERYNPEYLL